MLRWTKLFALWLALEFTFVANTSRAAVLNLDFGPTAIGTDPANTLASPYHGTTGDTTSTTWNTTLGVNDVGSGLLWGDGAAATGVSYNLGRTLTGNLMSDLINQPTSSSALGGVVGTGFYSSPNAARDGIFTTGGGQGLSLQIAGLPAGSYEIFFVGRNTNLGFGTPPNNSYTSNTIFAGTSSSAGDFNFSGYADPQTVSYTATNSTTWTSGQNYTKSSISIASGEYLNLAFVGAPASQTAEQRAFLNSLQIVSVAPVPEPSTYALLGLGGLVIAYRRSRSR